MPATGSSDTKAMRPSESSRTVTPSVAPSSSATAALAAASAKYVPLIHHAIAPANSTASTPTTMSAFFANEPFKRFPLPNRHVRTRL